MASRMETLAARYDDGHDTYDEEDERFGRILLAVLIGFLALLIYVSVLVAGRSSR